jgi:hypothetical protein
MKRIFVVGCPRSGTTIVQALLARYPGVLTLPETAFFESVFGGIGQRWQDPDARRDPWYRRHGFGFARSHGPKRLHRLETELLGLSQAPPWRIEPCIRRFVQLLDEVASSQDCAAWVEKTPNHVMYVDEIARHVADARFVHVLRNGEDVVASVVDADLLHPTHAFHGGVRHWVRRWNRVMDLQLAQLGAAGHYVICLEDLVEQFDRQWARLCAFLDFDPSLPLATAPHNAVADAALEPWKRNALSGVVRPTLRKSENLFGPRMLEWMRSNLASYDDIRARVARAHEGGAQRSCAAKLGLPETRTPGRDRAFAA